MDSALRSRLAALSRHPRTPEAARTRPVAPPAENGAAHPAAVAPAKPTRRKGRIPNLDEILPGRELTTPSGTCWLHERPLTAWAGSDRELAARLSETLRGEPPEDLSADPALQALRRLGLEAGFFLDLETTGLAGMPIFLAGILTLGSGATGLDPESRVVKPAFRLYFARDYREEKPLLEALGKEFERHPVVMTYNGKSYDIPYLRERAGRLRTSLDLSRPQLDLLHPARRRWSRRLPDCRLTSLEWHLCRRRRAGDIPGSEIPAAYHRWVLEGDPRPLLPVFRHNLLDLYTLAEVAGHVLGAACPPLDDGRFPGE